MNTKITTTVQTNEIQTTEQQPTEITAVSSFKDIAMEMVKRGIPVIPIPPRNKGTVLKNWPDLASTNPAQIEKWNQENQHYNAGSVAKVDGYWMLDCDVPGLRERIEQETGQSFPQTFSVRSSKGIHYYFRQNDASRQMGNLSVAGYFDAQVKNKYVVAPGSIHPTGKRYEVLNDAGIVEAPEWLVNWIKAYQQHSEADQHLMVGGDKIKQGGRDNFLFKQACRLRDDGLSQSDALTALLELNKNTCDPPLEESVVRLKIASAFSRKPSIETTIIEELIQNPETPSRTDLGNAKRLVHAEGKDIRFCFRSKKWFVWDGKKWTEDDTGEIHRRAKRTVQAILAEAAVIEDDRERKVLVAHEQNSESESRLNAMISLAKSESDIPVRLSDFDSDPMLFNCLNGTLDLKTGQLRESCRNNLISKIAPVEFDLNAACPTWLGFLDTITGRSTTLVEYLQRCAGYSLTGDTSEHALFLLYGTGANGKSTFLEALRFVFGHYAQSADFQSLMVYQGQAIRNDLAKLNGARFVTATESEDGKRMAENVVKQLTGGDTITARFLYENHFDFEPKFKLWLGTNHRPVIRGQDEGIWRRIKLIPFTVFIPADQQDRTLKDKLKMEAAGILNWALEGLAQWRSGGLRAPEVVEEATSEYRKDQDVLAYFLCSRCILEAGAESKAHDLYTAYRIWAQETGEHWTMNERKFSDTLGDRHFERVRRAAGVIWKGIGLPPKDENEESYSAPR